jgi:hypothetical protein
MTLINWCLFPLYQEACQGNHQIIWIAIMVTYPEKPMAQP